jgi:hypothetical protein
MGKDARIYSHMVTIARTFNAISVEVHGTDMPEVSKKEITENLDSMAAAIECIKMLLLED